MFKLLLLAFSLISCNNQTNQTSVNMNPAIDTAPSIHSFKVTALDGGVIDFAAFKGKKILIVNTASRCGYTRQYAELEKLYKSHKDKLVVIGFPANNFGGQEPGTNAEIQSFCTKNYGVSFPMAAKISVKGNDMAPIYQWLTKREKNGVLSKDISWNFNKFLIDENGLLLDWFDSDTEPLSNDILSRL